LKKNISVISCAKLRYYKKKQFSCILMPHSVLAKNSGENTSRVEKCIVTTVLFLCNFGFLPSEHIITPPLLHKRLI